MKKTFKSLILILLITLLVACGDNKQTLEKHLQFTEIEEGYEVSGYNKGLPANVVLPEAFRGKPVVKIAQDAFRASEIKSIRIPESYKIIEDEAFLNSLKLKKVIFSTNSNLVEIGNNAFWGTYSLKSITIPKSVEKIGELAFSKALNLKEINFEANSKLTEIGNAAFSETKSLKTITIPKSVKTIGSSVFSRSYGLESIDVESGNLFYSSLDGVLYNKNQTILIAYPAGKKALSFVFQESILEISNNAFYHSQHLKRLTLNNNIVKIGNYAFASSKELISVVIPLTVIDVGARAFKDSFKLSLFTYHSEIPTTWNSNWNSSNIDLYLNNSWYFDVNNNPQPK